jgi:chaperonin cofactor prefoldin
MLSASSDGDNSKDREREKIASQLKKVEEDYKVRVQVLEEQNRQVQS